MDKNDMTIEKIEDFICENIGKCQLPEDIEAMAKLTTALTELTKARAAMKTSNFFISQQNLDDLSPGI